MTHGPYRQLQDLLTKKEEQIELSEKEEKIMKDLKLQAEEEILKSAEVICTTCVAAFDRRLRHIRFAQVLIDEAT